MAKPKNAGPTREFAVQVNARILRHVSRGIYRTPAAALKELVSNAHDARARLVSINTGFPLFDGITISDDGDGMLEDEFQSLMERIGFSKKVAGAELGSPNSPFQRRTIGHYGIGFLAAGQLAGTMVITSKKAGSLKGFEAVFNFDQFDRVKSAEDEGIAESILKDEARTERIDARNPDDEKFPIGKCTIKTLGFSPAEKKSHFTRIELKEIRADIRKKLRGNVDPALKCEDKKRAVRLYSANFDALLKMIRANEGLFRLGQYPYEMLLWELAVYCPLIYPEVGPFKIKGPLHHFYKRAKRAQFSVVIDGFKLTKPYEAPFFDDSDYPVHKIFNWTNEVFYKSQKQSFKVSAYLILKQRIRPKILQGILLREAETAVGLYDSTFLEYPLNEGYKFNSITGEMFSEGLSGALNIDRNSFNHTDDVYLALAAWLHKKLNSEVFPFFKKSQQGPQSFRREKNNDEIGQILQFELETQPSQINKVRFAPEGKNAALFRTEGRTLVINKDHKDGKGSSAQKEKVLLAALLISKGLISSPILEGLLKRIETARKTIARQ